MSKMEKWEAEEAIKSYILFYYKFLRGLPAFQLPSWYIEARKVYGSNEAMKLWAELDEDLNDENTKQKSLGKGAMKY